MVKGVESVRERLLRLQKQNYRSIPLHKIEKPKSVEDEIKEFKDKSLIQSIEVSNLPKSNVLERLEKIDDSFIQPTETVTEEKKDDEPKDSRIEEINAIIEKIENLKKRMLETNNYLGLYYDLKKLERELVSKYDEFSAANVELPEHLSNKIASLLKSKSFKQ